MDRRVIQRIGFATVLHPGELPQLELLQASLTLFEPDVQQTWFIRRSNEGGKQAGLYDRVAAIEDAWNSGGCDAVLYLDSTLVVTSPILNSLFEKNADLVLAPFHSHQSRREDEKTIGPISSAFVFTRTHGFASWWRQSIQAQGYQSDNACLPEAEKLFRVQFLDQSANHGYWRGTPSLDFPPIPVHCSFMNVAFFEPNLSPEELIERVFGTTLLFGIGKGEFKPAFNGPQLTNKAFGLHCLQFLRSSSSPLHQNLFDQILLRDRLQLYAAEFDSNI